MDAWIAGRVMGEGRQRSPSVCATSILSRDSNLVIATASHQRDPGGRLPPHRPGENRCGRSGISRSRSSCGSRLQVVDEVRRALRVAGRGEDRAVVCLEHVQPVGDVGGVVLTPLKRQIKIGHRGTRRRGRPRVLRSRSLRTRNVWCHSRAPSAIRVRSSASVSCARVA